MKPSSIGVAIAIAASNLSVIALLSSQSPNIATNLESQPSQISTPSNSKIAGRDCSLKDPLCGWWIIIEDLLKSFS